jgi:hypothetical protein
MRSIRQLTSLLVSALALVTGASIATAASIKWDFESVSTTSSPSIIPGALATLTLTDASGLSLTLTRPGGAHFDVYNSSSVSFLMPASWGSHSLDEFFDISVGFIGDLSAPVTSVSLDYGDFGADADTLTLTAFSGSGGTGTQLGSSVDSFGTASFPTFDTVTVSAAGIRSFTITGTSTSAGGPDSVFLDNFVVTQAVPEPTTAGLLLSITATLASRRMNRGIISL